MHRYEEEADFPKGLNGRFHGLVADAKRGTAMLFNDRFGLQRLYYHEAKDGFYFAAEAKAILKVRTELRETDPRGTPENSSVAGACSRTGPSFGASMCCHPGSLGFPWRSTREESRLLRAARMGGTATA